MKLLVALSLLGCALSAAAAERTVALLQDPAGDDDGNGALIYPQRADFERGDLDLLSLRIANSTQGYRFEATFRNPVRSPASIMADVGGESLAEFARRGFYAFNLDIYIDQDRVAGSGNTYTLPGRHATLDPSYAWERAVILTPRPELMRQQLIDTVAESESENDRDAVARRIDAAICFPTQVTVRGRSISFVVPAAFFAVQRPDADWAVTAFVTGAKTSTEMDLNLLRGSGDALARIPIDDLALGVMQPTSGRPRDTFGYSSVTVPSPIVDVLAPTALQQQKELSAGLLTGIGWGGGMATAPGESLPVTSLTRAVAAAPAKPAASVAPKATHEPAKASPPISDAVAERLRRIKLLHDEGLISDEEYNQLRRKILSEL